VYERYFDAVDRLLRMVRETNRHSIPAAASVIADTIAADGIVRAFGSGHSQILALELFDRAGGLAPIDVIIDPSRGRAEGVEGYAATLLHEDQLQPADCLIVISTSGRNVSPIEMALIGRERGVPVVAVTAVEFSRSVASRHSSGKRLLDVADVVLDTCGAIGDAAVHIDGVPTDVGPTSTVLGSAVLNAVMVEAVDDLVRRGLDTPVFASQNLDGTADYNAALSARYRGRIRDMP
jgi:uncharacterized phosphosugar-binding protein